MPEKGKNPSPSLLAGEGWGEGSASHPGAVVRGLTALFALILSTSVATGAQAPPSSTETPVTYTVEPPSTPPDLRKRFSRDQLRLLEKLNRADLEHLPRLKALVIPERWDLDELSYSPLPKQHAWAERYPKAFVVHQPSQVFGAYEAGRLVHWGPVSSGRQEMPTPSGLFYTNWRSPGRHSTVNPEWFMRWYFNIENRRGISLHAYELPGYPASHACVRFLDRDAKWLYDWGEEWQLDASGRTVLRNGTPVLIAGEYNFAAPPPWRSPEWLARCVELPP